MKKQMRFIKSNPHPKGKKIGDCVVRAIAIAEAKKWDEVYDALCYWGKFHKDMPNSKIVYEDYLRRAGYVKHKMPKHPNGKRMKLSELTEVLSGSLGGCGTFIAHVSKHLATVEDGILLDTWDCGHKCVGNYYRKPRTLGSIDV